MKCQTAFSRSAGGNVFGRLYCGDRTSSETILKNERDSPLVGQTFPGNISRPLSLSMLNTNRNGSKHNQHGGVAAGSAEFLCNSCIDV